MTHEADFAELLKRLVAGRTLNAGEAGFAFTTIMSGEVPQNQIAAFLTAMAERSPTVEEIVGGAKAMRKAMTSIRAPRNAIDLCGTGGDGHSTLNISTAATLVVAACGVPVAKHGNRSASSKTGTADVLEKLGVKIDVPASVAEDCLREIGICFLFAPRYHAAMKHVAPVRKELGFRTVFNLLGPLANPAQVKRQLLGVYAAEWVDPIAQVLKELGTQKAWVVHGSDGLDELTTSGPTAVAVLDSGRIISRVVTPEEIGIARISLDAIKGGDVDENAAALTELLDGAPGAFRNVTLLNAAAALVVADKASDLKAGAKLAAEAIDSGAAKDVLARLVAATQK